MTLRMLLMGLAVWGVMTAPSPARAEEPMPARVTGQFTLVDQDGRPVTEASYGGALRVMTFGYTFCPDICPTTLAAIAAAMDLLGPDAAQVVPIFVTVDPRRDTPAVLKSYVAAFHPRMAGLSGTPEAVETAARNFRVRFVVNAPTGTDPLNYTVDHSAGIYIMGRDGRFLAKLAHLAPPEDIAGRIRGLLR